MNVQSPQLPSLIEAEQQLLGAVMLNNDIFHAKCGMLKADHFFDPVHARIWSAITARVLRDELASPVTLKVEMESDAGLKELGGPAYLARMAGSAVSTYAAADYVREIIETSEKRRMIVAMQDEIAALRSGGRSQDTAAALELVAIEASENSVEPRTMSLMKAHTQSITEMNEVYQTGNVGLSFGLKSLDDKVVLKPKRSTILAGATSMGKTSLATFIACSVAKQNYGVGFVSLEMGEEDLANRLNSIESRVPYQAMDRPLSETLFRKVVETAKGQSELPIEIMSSRVSNMAAILSETKRLQKWWVPNDQFHGLGLLVIDYLQIVRGKGSSFEVLTQVSRETKAIAKMLNIHVIGLAQVDRGMSKRDSKIPHLGDLRGSGDLENDADNVIFIHRPSYYFERMEKPEKDDERADLEAALNETKGTADLIIAKQRMGELATVRVGCDLGCNRFWDIKTQNEIDF